MTIIDKKSYRQHFKILLLIFALMLALLHGLDFGTVLLPEIIDISTEILRISFSEKIYSALVAALGTIILLISVLVLLKRAFKIIDGKTESKVKIALAQRICLSLGGFFEGFTDRLTCSSAVRVIRKYVNNFKSKVVFDKQIKTSSLLLTFRFSRILI